MNRYWVDRAEESIRRMEGQIRDDIPELIDSFEQAKHELQKEINSFYGRYAFENKISLAEAQKQLSFAELREFQGNLKTYQDLTERSIGTFNLQLNNLSTKARMTRLQALEFECDTILQRLYQQLQDRIEQAVSRVYTNQYYHKHYEMAQYNGFQHDFAKVSQSAIDKVLAMPVMGADISTRLWRQDIDTGFKIRQTLNTMFATGKPPQDFANQLQNIIGNRDKAGNLTGKKHEAYRLLYNESAYACVQADLDAYQESGVEEYEICATLDVKTSSVCRDMDGKHFPTEKAVIGENCPPFHVNCRTTTVPYVEALKTTRSARDPETGKSVETNAQTYTEWYAENVKKKGEYDSILDKHLPNETPEDKKLKQRFEDDLSILPQKHIDILENTVQNVIISTDKPSGYSSKLKTLRIKQDFSKGHMVHEVGHVIADYYKVYDDKAFVAVLRSGLENFDLGSIVDDETSFVQKIQRIESEKFISLYQGNIKAELGVFEGDKINPKCLNEYFSEGYREFFENARNLKDKDNKLYEYIRKLVER